MQRDKDLHQLFRAHLPIAVLPPEFADRLAKAVLNEVAQLHQATPLVINREENQTVEPEQLNAPATTQKSPPFNYSKAILVFLLLLNLQLWPLLQGCSYNAHGTLSVQIIADKPGSQTKVATNRPAVAVLQAAPAGALAYRPTTSNKPALGPVTPSLPIPNFLPAQPLTLIPTATASQLAAPTVEEQLVNQHRPPLSTQQPASMPPVRIPYQQLASAQATATAPLATPTSAPTTSEQDEPTVAIPSETITSEASREPTATATMAPLPPQSAIHIFEPTLSPTPILSDSPAPTPTLYIRPWHTPTPEATATTSHEMPEATHTPSS